MILSDLLQGIKPIEIIGETNLEITGIHYDSRKIKPGYLFICITGLKTDGHLYIKQAVANGAIAIIAEKKEFCVESITLVKVLNSKIGRAHV